MLSPSKSIQTYSKSKSMPKNNTLSDFNTDPIFFLKKECCNKTLTNIKISEKLHKINHDSNLPQKKKHNSNLFLKNKNKICIVQRLSITRSKEREKCGFWQPIALNWVPIEKHRFHLQIVTNGRSSVNSPKHPLLYYNHETATAPLLLYNCCFICY